MKHTEYYKSGKHLENLKIARDKSTELSKINSLTKLKSKIVEYENNKKICVECGNFHSFEKRNNVCCSKSCTASFSNKKRGPLSDKIKQSISNGVKKTNPIKIKKCKYCDIDLSNFVNRKISCDSCNKIVRSNAAKLSLKKQIESGVHKGWKARTKEPSYAEKYFIDLFHNEKLIGYEQEKKVNKWFIDFAFNDKMIAIEIDGAQHNHENRKKSDLEKDEYLKSIGWNVIRIKWLNPISKINKDRLYPQIEKMKSILRDTLNNNE